MDVEEMQRVADSRMDRVIVDRVSYARGWLERNETAKKELAEARAKLDAAVKVTADLVEVAADLMDDGGQLFSREHKVALILKALAAKRDERGKDPGRQN